MGTENLQEQKDLITQKEEKVYQILLAKGLDKKYPNFKVNQVQENIFVISNEKGVHSYSNEKGEAILNIDFIKLMQFVNTGEAILGSGYFEKKEGNTSNLYRVLGLDEKNQPVLEEHPINPLSKDYYDAWKNIDFNATILDVDLLKKQPAERFNKEELKQIEKNLFIDIKTGAVTIDDIEGLYGFDEKTGIQDEKMKKISEDTFKKAISKVVEEKLLFQCSDERIDDVKHGITVKKLKSYYAKGYISVEIAENFRLAIETKEKKQKKENKIGVLTGKKLDEIK
ncbi:MAG: hypothetical protein PHZ26_03385 [Candidatus Gracilibacteria bacterium]|nr:hypothetical protein [Candidatus Gracilibacteria bacterium]MDD2908770.1 hypothetical protein [Candidatus Gracilibacteria bacterium]